MEKIKIDNFAGISSMEVEFKAINVLIGPQGVGKSVTVKLLYFFKGFFGEILRSIEDEESKQELDKRQKERFLTFFPKDAWPAANFKIIYSLDETIITIQHAKELHFTYSDNLERAITKAQKVFGDEKNSIQEDIRRSSFSFKQALKQKLESVLQKELGPLAVYGQFFIPAGRSFFANIQMSIFSLLRDNRSFDPFLIEFGSVYESLKQFYTSTRSDNQGKEFEEIIYSLLQSTYQQDKDSDFLVHPDGRKVNLSNASSGQQEILPLVVILKALNVLYFPGAVIYIEEPEAHLFPNTQKLIVRLLARLFNNTTTNFQIIITTHSPYMLSSFNNLIQAGRLKQHSPDQAGDIDRIVPVQEQIRPELMAVYALNGSGKKDLIDEESQLIAQTILDDVSSQINTQFDHLLDLEFSNG